MSPESPGNLIALDLEWNGSKLECQVERYDNGGDFLYVSWKAIEAPEHYVPVGGGAAYVWVPEGFTHRKYRARVDPVNDGFEWIDVAQVPIGAMLILTLPPNHTFVYADENASYQSPVRFKSTDDERMALYWWLEPGRFEVEWQMAYLSSEHIEAQCRLLNQEAKRREQPAVAPVHMDRPAGHEVNRPSYQSEVLDGPPEWVAPFQIPDKATGTYIFAHQVTVDSSKRETTVRQEKVINIGNEAQISAPLVIADTIDNSFNTLMESAIDDDLKTLLDQLLKAVIEVNKVVPQDKVDEAEAMVRDAETLVKEATSSKPRREWYSVSIEGLKQAAINIGEVAVPILNIVKKLTPLLLA